MLGMVDFAADHEGADSKRMERSISILNRVYRRHSLVPVEWLDEHRSGIKKVLAPAMPGRTFGPIIGGEYSTATNTLPAVRLYAFEAARVSAVSSSVLLEDRIVIERAEGVDLSKCNYAAGPIALHSRSTAMVDTGPTERLTRGFFLAGNGSFNYYHWMVEILPKLAFLRTTGGEYADFPILVHEDIVRVESLRDSLKPFADGRPIIGLEKGKTYLVDELLYVNSPSICPFNNRSGSELTIEDFFVRPEAVRLLREGLCKARPDGGNQPGRRVFFGRRGTRRSYNQDEVFEIFARHGFAMTYMEELSLAEQTSLIQSAEFVAGPTGAAWTNLLFCREGAKCLCWMAEEAYWFAGYSTIARIVGADLRYVTYRMGTKATSDLYWMDYRVDPVEVENALLSLLRDSDTPRVVPIG